jgi:hypothetical protein
MAKKKPPPATSPPSAVRDRVREFRRVRASELAANARNPKSHPPAQRQALRALLAEIGFAGAELCYHSARNGGALTLIDGHMRREEMGDAELPCLVLDLDDAEADKLMATFDPLGAMAEADAAKLDALLREVQTGDDALAALLAELQQEVSETELSEAGGGDGPRLGGATRDVAVKVVIPVADLAGVERAIALTGNVNRGEALAQICREYAELHAHETR